MMTNVRRYLIEIARKRQIVFYQQLSDNCDLSLNMAENPQDRIEIGKIIGEISEFEYRQNRPLLSSLVLTRNGDEGDGFYKLCEDLKITNNWRKMKKDGIFASLEIKKCHEFWADMDNYNKFI